MSTNPFLGVGLHGLGGLAAGSFYIPFKQVRHWSWESYWLVGITICAYAGVCKERELSAEAKTAVIREFDFAKGVLVALFAGVMSACMAYGIAAGKPIAAVAVKHHVPPLWQNGPVFIVILAGGFTTNFLWCLFLNKRNRSARDYVNAIGSPLIRNYFFSALAGVTWYLQFMFYGMGTTQMGKHDYASWTIHMAFIIAFSNLWGLYFHEWKGSSRRTHEFIFAGIGVLVLSTLVVGYANYLAEPGP